MWRDFHNRAGLEIKAIVLNKADSLLEKLYRFRFEQRKMICSVKGKSMTILRDKQRVLFKREGYLSNNDYLTIKKLIEKSY